MVVVVQPAPLLAGLVRKNPPDGFLEEENRIIYMVVVVQLVRTPDCGSGGRGFESHLPPKSKARYECIGLFVYKLNRNIVSAKDINKRQ